MTKRIREAAEEYASKQAIGTLGAVPYNISCNSYRAGAEWMLAEVLRELRNEYIWSEYFSDPTIISGAADLIESRFKGE